MMRAVLPLLLLAAPAAAHDGPHLHPHGAEAVWAVAVVGLAVAAAVLVRLRGRR